MNCYRITGRGLQMGRGTGLAVSALLEPRGDKDDASCKKPPSIVQMAARRPVATGKRQKPASKTLLLLASNHRHR